MYEGKFHVSTLLYWCICLNHRSKKSTHYINWSSFNIYLTFLWYCQNNMCLQSILLYSKVLVVGFYLCIYHFYIILSNYDTFLPFQTHISICPSQGLCSNQIHCFALNRLLSWVIFVTVFTFHKIPEPDSLESSLTPALVNI